MALGCEFVYTCSVFVPCFAPVLSLLNTGCGGYGLTAWDDAGNGRGRSGGSELGMGSVGKDMEGLGSEREQ